MDSRQQSLNLIELPNHQRMMKLIRWTDLQTGLVPLAILLFLLSLMLLRQAATFGSRYGEFYAPLKLVAIAGFVVVAGLLIAVASFRRFYLIDSDRRCVYRGLKMFFASRVRLAFEREDIAAIATEGKRVSNKGGTYWYYRVVLLSATGVREPLSKWWQENLQRCNEDATKVAEMLDCPLHLAPEHTLLQYRIEGGNPVITFGPFKFFNKELIVPLLVMLAIILAGFVLLSKILTYPLR
ncbi:MAG: hypothetical protein C5B50_23470 [Verrucomicrobia bacterium]|nr:MAG: hypothetical protein C5B50_23470 [Verrucomicrobiota bacterium]